jgi:acid stress-induced BolA-like protein IbaG/YrbA
LRGAKERGFHYAACHALTVHAGRGADCRPFEGKGLVERHQVVYATLGDAMRARVHALQLKTLTPAQFQNRR